MGEFFKDVAVEINILLARMAKISVVRFIRAWRGRLESVGTISATESCGSRRVIVFPRQLCRFRQRMTNVRASLFTYIQGF